MGADQGVLPLAPPRTPHVRAQKCKLRRSQPLIRPSVLCARSTAALTTTMPTTALPTAVVPAAARPPHGTDGRANGCYRRSVHFCARTCGGLVPSRADISSTMIGFAKTTRGSAGMAPLEPPPRPERTQFANGLSEVEALVFYLPTRPAVSGGDIGVLRGWGLFQKSATPGLPRPCPHPACHAARPISRSAPRPGSAFSPAIDPGCDPAPCLVLAGLISACEKAAGEKAPVTLSSHDVDS